MSSIVLKPARSQACVRVGARITPGSVLDLGFEPDIIIECTGVGIGDCG